MMKWFSTFGAALSLCVGLCPIHAKDLSDTPIDSLLIFGNSYSDIGAGNAVAESLGQPLPSPTPPYYDNRHSNGPIWVDYTSKELGVPVIDYAVSGAETGSGNDFNPVLGGLFQQLGRFEANEKRVHKEQLSFVEAGGNDYLALLDTEDFTPEAILTTTTQAITNMQTVLVTLQDLGADKIVVWNLGDMGLLPQFTDPTLGLTALAPFYTAASEAYNGALLQLIQGLNAYNQTFDDKPPMLFLFNAYDVFNEIEAELRAEGVNLEAHTITALPGPDGGYIVVSPPPVDPAFYDQLHPTTSTWKIFSKYMSAFIDTLVNGPRFMASEQDLAFDTTRAHRDVIENHLRTLHMMQYVYSFDCCNCNQFQLYTDFDAKWGETKNRKGAFGLNYNTQVALLGMDYRLSECLNFGAAFAAQTSYAKVGKHHGHITLNDYVPTLYASCFGPEFFIDTDASYHFYNFENLDRKIPFLDKTAHAKTYGQGIEFNIELGYVAKYDCMTLIPIAGMGFENLYVRGYQEKGAGFINLKTHRQHQTSCISKLGAQVFLGMFECGLIPFGEVLWEHEFLRHDRRIGPRLFESNDGSVDYAHTGHAQRDWLRFVVGLDAQIYDNVSANISYEGETSFDSFVNNSLVFEIDTRF